MDPYKAPDSKVHGVPQLNGNSLGGVTSGDKLFGPCPHCSSVNGKKSNLSQQRPSIIFFLLVGWIYLLIKAISRKTTVLCGDCDEYYKV